MTSELEYARREASTLAQLDHRNVVKFVDFLDDEKPEWVLGHVCFLITDFCSGGSLVEWIKEMKNAGRRTTADEARIIAAQLVSALSFCHDQKPAIVHQDIKPANVFVMDDFITKCSTTRPSKNQLSLEVNIQRHEHRRSTRTSLFDVFGENADEFADFEVLLEKCTRADRSRRPKNAVELRNEDVRAVFRYRLEKGERPCEIVSPPFEDEKDAQIRLLKEELAKKDKKIAELENGKVEDGQNREIIEKENSKLKTVNEKLKKELAKIRPSFAKIESELNEARNLIQQLTTEHESEREQWKNFEKRK
ncbi:unnamed protein product [Oikopleura dioica]|uniref:Protein kinase domain-containing protein n=1 Tax=Oikopleura dioica TaxID=34765 RepID=E4XNG8_OIKDI|nr:unnamed protein product [Oikopleura dioica]